MNSCSGTIWWETEDKLKPFEDNTEEEGFEEVAHLLKPPSLAHLHPFVQGIEKSIRFLSIIFVNVFHIWMPPSHLHGMTAIRVELKQSQIYYLILFFFIEHLPLDLWITVVKDLYFLDCFGGKAREKGKRNGWRGVARYVKEFLSGSYEVHQRVDPCADHQLDRWAAPRLLAVRKVEHMLHRTNVWRAQSEVTGVKLAWMGI